MNTKPSINNLRFDLLDSNYKFHMVHLVYMSYFNRIPNNTTLNAISVKKAHDFFKGKYANLIEENHFKEEIYIKSKELEFIYRLKGEVLIYFGIAEIEIFHSEKTEIIKEIQDSLLKFRIRKKTNTSQINLVTTKNGHFYNQIIDFKKPKIDLNQIYNSKFCDYNEKILKILRKKSTSGLHLLYGKPGTGKSTYIRYLCGKLKKDIIFLPGQLAQNLDNVTMTQYLISNANSVLVIEDAEELIVSRDNQRNSNLSMILNMTDGILGESLGIQIIATFNTDLKNIDPALKRKGRLKSSYEFEALSTDKANHLLQKAGIKQTTDTALTLAEIYNFREELEMKSENRKAIGFK